MKKHTQFGVIEDHIGFQIHVTWRAIKKCLLAAARKGGDRVSPGSYSVPILIGLNPGITPLELARALHLDASKIALLLKGLEADEMVVRTPLAEDGRKIGLTLTAKGEAFARQAKFMSEIMEDPISETITDDERRELIRILTKIQASIQHGPMQP